MERYSDPPPTPLLPPCDSDSQHPAELSTSSPRAVVKWDEWSAAERTLFNHAPDAIVMLDVESGLFLDANRAAEELFGYSREELQKLGPFAVSPERQPNGLSSELGLSQISDAVDGQGTTFDWWHTNSKGERFPCDVHLVKMPWKDRVIVRGSIFESSGKKLLELSQVGLNQILQQIAEGASLGETLNALLLAIEGLLPGMRCSALLLDRQSNRLRHGAAPSLPNFYNAAVDGLEIGPTVGSCGAAAFTGQRVIATDIMQHGNWTPYRELAQRAGLRACWSEPLFSATGSVLGTFAMYYGSPLAPAAVELKAIQSAAQMTSMAIERIQAQRSLEELNATLERRIDEKTQHLVKANEALKTAEQDAKLSAVAFEVRESIVITDKNGRILRVNASFTELTGYLPSEVVGKTPRILRSGRHNREFYESMWRDIREQGHWEGEIWNRRKTGEPYLQRLIISAVKDASGEISHYVASGHDLAQEKQAEADRAEILAAQRVQQSLLPARSPRLPGFDIAGAVHPADQISGDFFNYFSLGENAWGLMVADVSGHGLGAGLVMAQMHTHLRSLSELCSDPGEILNRGNRAFWWNDPSHFVTIFLSRLDVENRTFTYCGAGHQAYLIRADGDVKILKSTTPPLGVEEQLLAKSSSSIGLETGDIVLLPTDGIEESRNVRNELFGKERMLDVVRANAHLSASNIVDAIYVAARDFAGEQPQADDITAIVLKVAES